MKMSRRKQSNPKPLLKRDDEDEQGDQSAADGTSTTTDGETVADATMNKEFSEPPSRTGTPGTTVESPAPSQTSARSASSPRIMSPAASTASSEPSVDNKYLDVELELAKSMHSAAVTAASEKLAVPKLRLNIALASDPAANPEAKEITAVMTDDNNSTRDEKEEEQSRPESILSATLNIVAAEQIVVAPPRIPIYTCIPCGIKFSSASTLEAHQTYYCSHRKDQDEPTPALPKAASTADTSGEPPTKSIKTGKQYACSQCSYSADKKVSLNRHMRMHQTSPAASSASNGTEEVLPTTLPPQPVAMLNIPPDRYCADCDIRFSSTKTYRAHKQHYCQSRHRDGVPNSTPKASSQKSGSQSPAEPNTSSPADVPAQPFLALPTNPIIIVPYSILRNASVIPSTSLASNVTPNSESTCFVLQNGTLQPIAYSLATQAPQQEVPTQPRQTPSTGSQAAERAASRSSEVLKDVNKKLEGKDATPLDLSVRRLSPALSLRERSALKHEFRMEFESLLESKENLSVSGDSVTPEQIVCAPSLPGSPPLTPSPKRRSNSPRGSAPMSPIAIPTSPRLIRPQLPPEIIALRLSDNSALVNELRMRIESPQPALKKPSPSPLPLPPQIYVKKGSSKCIECNIVFCKQENYIAHKKHYCSARNLDDGGEKSSPPLSPNQASPKPPLSYQQLICAACGIKFTSLDNLNAHQMYYCPKRIDLQVQQQMQKIEKCSKCKASHEPGTPCIINSSTAYKCPICEIVSPNSVEAKRHVETHGGIKAFRCAVCRYKGNTLRGMRTHIRMHFDKKSGVECNEENYITCIVEEDRFEIPPSGLAISSSSPLPPPATTPTTEQQNQMFFCDLCNYSSTYKGNVVRHAKLVHQQGQSNSNSPPIGEGGEALIYNGGDSAMNIKNEPMEDEPEVVIKESPEVTVKIEAKESPDVENTDDHSHYCEKCDIKFKFLNSYMAHKQFYCKNGANSLGADDLQSLNKNQQTVVQRATETSVQ